MSDYHEGLVLELRNLCHPLAEAMSDRSRIDTFVRYGLAAADEIERLRAENERLRALLKAVVQEADRSTHAFDEARAALKLAEGK
jgi:hypothetical protein